MEVKIISLNKLSTFLDELYKSLKTRFASFDDLAVKIESETASDFTTVATPDFQASIDKLNQKVKEAEGYYQQTKDLKDQVDATVNLVVPNFYVDFDTGKLMSDKKSIGMSFWLEDGVFYGELKNNETEVTV